MSPRAPSDPLALFHPAVRRWFTTAFGELTEAQHRGWPAIARGQSTLILAPTGSGKTLAAFLWSLNRLMFESSEGRGCRVLYLSPLKALAIDVERNLQAPLAGILEEAARHGEPARRPTIAIRTGDTPAAERARFQREPSDILITTPESLYLLLTSNARQGLRGVGTVIIDEIHALVPNKRGAHLALSLERLAAICPTPPQRIGLSATERPLDEVAKFLGGAAPGVGHRPQGPQGSSTSALSSPERQVEHQFAGRRTPAFRPVTVVDAGTRKPLKLSVEVPDENAPFHPRLIELIRAHRSTLIFVNSRRLAERLAGALNELAGETLVRSHHGSIARAQRTEVEELLKAGRLRALVATSSLELGIDMGAIDLVVQIEAPPSVASGLQRIGRAGHHVHGVSEGIIFPKFKGDLLASAAVVKAMHHGQVEETRYPRNPLDVLAQQIVAMVSMEEWHVDALFQLVRSASPFAELGRAAFDGILDMLSGRYPSDEFAELRPRITWDRIRGVVRAREGAKRVAIANGGTIPDRGLYGVFLQGAANSSRVGELDEEMVFESRVGDVFVLGASSWRIEEITHDRVLVSPAPGQPGKMPFWKGDRAGRPLELGLAIGRLTRELTTIPPAPALDRLVREHDLHPRAAQELLQYLREQMAAARAVPDEATILIERVRDELGDWRVCVLSPRGGRIHAPWAMAAAAAIRAQTGIDVETLWGDDGFVVRFPDVDHPPDPQLLLPDPDQVHALVVGQVGGTALFAAKFRENAARSLLLPKRRPGMRAPLWQQRKRAADLLAVASRYGSFPIVLETYRECLRDFFDMAALEATLADVRSRKIRVTTIDSERPSPFAASLLFNYVASFIYDGDAPLAERRAQALVVDQAQLGELLGDAELRDLLDADAIQAVERQLQWLDSAYPPRTADAVHDMLLRLGDLTVDEIAGRAGAATAPTLVNELLSAGRVLEIEIAGQARYIAVEDAARYRDGLGIVLPPGVPAALLDPVSDPRGDLALRFARTHAPFTVQRFADRYGLAGHDAERLLVRLAAERRLLEGEFCPGGTAREWTDAGVLRKIRARSLAKLRQQVEPVSQQAFARFGTIWQGVVTKRRGTDALLDAIDQLQGAPVAVSILETEILPARVEQYDPVDLDALAAGGEITWVGLEAIGDRDGRIALYRTDHVDRLLPPAVSRLKASRSTRRERSADRDEAIVNALRARGAMFFGALHEAAGGGYPGETVDALWRLAWRGALTNDTFHALRAYSAPREDKRRRLKPGEAVPARSRRIVPPSAEGRWSLVGESRHPASAWGLAVAEELLARHGIVTRQSLSAERIPGGFSTVYPVLKALEENGRVRRGYFVAGLGGAQFALPGAIDLLRSFKGGHEAETVVLASTDPANPYGAQLKWPDFSPQPDQGPMRIVGSTVILVTGALAAYLTRGDRELLTRIPENDPERTQTARAIARALIERARSSRTGEETPRGMLIETIDGVAPSAHQLLPFFIEAGFMSGALGLAPDPRKESARIAY